MENDTIWIHQAKLGDPHAFAVLYSEVYKEMYRFALYMLKHPHDAEDAVSDAVTDAWAQIRSLKKEESFKAWIFRILSNKCRQKLKQYTQKTVELPEDLQEDIGDREEGLDVRSAFSRLNDEDRMILALHIFAGYSSREIGRMLHMSDGTVRSRQKRALEKMETYLA